MLIRLNITFMVLFLTSVGYGQNDVFELHPNHKLYPFRNIEVENDSVKNILAHFYFACREADGKKSLHIKEQISRKVSEHNWVVNPGIWNFNSAYYYRINGQIDQAINYYNLAKNHFQNENNSLAVLWSEMGLANCDYLLDRKNIAFTKYLELFKHAEKLDTHLTASLAFNIAISYHERYSIAESKEEKELNIPLALNYYEIVLEKNIEAKDYLGASHTYCLYGAFHSLIGNRELGASQLDSAMFYAEKSNLEEQVAFIQINQGNHFIEENQIEKGINSINKAFEYYVKVENHNMCALAMLRKAEAYQKTGQYALANDCNKERTRFRDLFYAQSLIEKSAFYESEFKTKELQNKTLEQEEKIEQVNKEKLLLENQRLNWTIWAMILSFLLILTLIGFWFFSKNKNKKVALQKQELEINLQQKLISETIRLQDEDRLRIGRDIHDGICQTITGLKLNQMRLMKESNSQNEKFQTELKNNIELIESLYKEARDVSHELAPPGITHNSLPNLIEDIFMQMLGDLKVTINIESLNENTFENDTDKKLNLVRIFQELTTNIVKHSQATEVKIQAYERKKHLIFRIEDNGIGINKGVLVEGIGLQSIRYRVKILNGRFSLENDQGLICLLKIPL